MRRGTKDLLIFLFCTIFIVVRYFNFIPKPQEIFYEKVGEKVVFSGIVDVYPDVRANHTRLVIKPENLNWKILVPVYDDTYDFKYGDILNVSGVLVLPEGFETDTGKIFDYRKYLLAQNIFFIIEDAEIKKINEGGNKIKKILFYVRSSFEDSLGKVLPARDKGFINGLLLGVKGGIDDEDEKAFIRTGTIHIVALSGFNVMIIAEAMLYVGRIITYGIFSYIFSGITVILFVILAGASSTALRAGIMAIISILARTYGRTYMAIRALFIASLLMLFINPRIIFDVSFHLSFIATFGVITLPNKFLKYLNFIPSFYGLRNMILVTLSATVIVTPYIIYTMGNLSILSLIVNILILPVIALLMLMGFLSGVFGFVSPFVGMIFGYVTHIINNYVFGVVGFFSKLPFANLTINHFPLIFVLIFYAWILWWTLWKNRASQK